MCLHEPAGNRLCLNAEARAAFLAVARRQPARDGTFGETLHYTGCRPSEPFEITPARMDLSGGTVTIRGLNKRKDASGAARIVHRSMEVPPDYLDRMNTAHGLGGAQRSRRQANIPIWQIGRLRVWQIVKWIIIEAGIPDAPQRSPKGLRHGFGISVTVSGVPLQMLQKWTGHGRAAQTQDQVAFPMSRHRPVLHLGGTRGNYHLGRDEELASATDTGARNSERSTRSQAGGQFVSRAAPRPWMKRDS